MTGSSHGRREKGEGKWEEGVEVTNETEEYYCRWGYRTLYEWDGDTYLPQKSDRSGSIHSCAHRGENRHSLKREGKQYRPPQPWEKRAESALRSDQLLNIRVIPKCSYCSVPE